jgi:hypothetical protein
MHPVNAAILVPATGKVKKRNGETKVLSPELRRIGYFLLLRSHA